MPPLVRRPDGHGEDALLRVQIWGDMPSCSDLAFASKITIFVAKVHYISTGILTIS
jgi:hypothetical protein